MKIQFNYSLPIAPEEVADSMQFDSGQSLAELRYDGWLASLEVRGEVRVVWNPDPGGTTEGGTAYRHASDFPEDLMDVFAHPEKHDRESMQNLFVDDNNWFEVFVEKDGRFVESFVVDLKDYKPETVLETLMFYCRECRKYELEERVGRLAERLDKTDGKAIVLDEEKAERLGIVRVFLASTGIEQGRPPVRVDFPDLDTDSDVSVWDLKEDFLEEILNAL